MPREAEPEHIRIGHERIVGRSSPPLVVAEMSGSHNGELARALDIVDMAADAGADAIKLQTYTADTITIDHDGGPFRLADSHPLWGGRKLYDLYSVASTPWEWHAEIFERAHQRGMIAFSSPFDLTAVDFLEHLDVPLYKIASLEIGDIALLRAVARTGKPVVLSNGAATLADVELAVETIRAEGNEQIILLACTSSYPADPAESNLRSIPTLSASFAVQVGLSDHTLGIGAAVASVALGATLIEKHVTLDRHDGGVDSAFALEAEELAALVTETRTAWKALGSTRPMITAREVDSAGLRRSLYIVADVEEGDEVTHANVRSIRPAGGLPPRYLEEVIGQRFSRGRSRGTPLAWGDL